MPNVTVTFEMSDGRKFRCEYEYDFTPGNYSGRPENCFPSESEVHEAKYFIDNKQVTLDALPKGLNVIAVAMYENGEDDARFSYTESEASHDGPEYDEDDYEIWDGPY
ncbi:MAG: hypothetical protein JST16_01615 [Bdellovibrionales bacterium]|nr:hypothetical protein [Bdellovibrionales bacterium]